MTYVVACYTIKVFVGSIQIIMNKIRGENKNQNLDEEPVVITKEEWEEIKEEIKQLKEFKNKMK
tara:strand:+ start:131 stop:322 length:192 start_codon:yes stop_codon:yes gene_type:complete